MKESMEVEFEHVKGGKYPWHLLRRTVLLLNAYLGNKLKLEVRTEGIKDGYFLPPHITTPEDAIKYVTDRGTEDRRRRRSEAEASEKVGNAFLQIGGSSFKSDYFGKIPGSDLKSGSTSYHQTDKLPALTTPAPAKHNARKCPVKPQKKCTTTRKKTETESP